jgi:hypothetical protein
MDSATVLGIAAGFIVAVFVVFAFRQGMKVKRPPEGVPPEETPPPSQ